MSICFLCSSVCAESEKTCDSCIKVGWKVCTKCKKNKLNTDYYNTSKQCKDCMKCEHGKFKANCKICKGTKKCKVCLKKLTKDIKTCNECENLKRCKTCDKIKNKDMFQGANRVCKDCLICEHNINKISCRLCYPQAWCNHNIKKTLCNECGGGGLCEHDKPFSKCKTCGGSAYCSHGIPKAKCKECGGSAFCKKHPNKLKSHCKECGGSAFCKKHPDKIKQFCKDCKGSGICEHRKNKQFCKDCGGSQICEHRKIKQFCKDCGGSAFCEHGKNKNACKDCRGSMICDHSKFKNACLDCCPDKGCKECKLVLVDKKTLCYPYCEACFCNLFPNHERSRLYKTKERILRDELRKKYEDADIDFIFDKTVDGGCSKRKPDVLIECFTHSIIIECDEFQHKNYECENKRSMQIFLDLGNRPIVFIRFNPDSYVNKNGERIQGCFKALIKEENAKKKKYFDIDEEEWKIRLEILYSNIEEYLDLKGFPEKEVTEVMLYYDGF